MLLPCLALSIVMPYSFDTLIVLNGVGVSRRVKDVRASDIGVHVCFFPNLRRSRVHVNLNASSWDCAFVEKVKLEESFVDLLFRHIVLWQQKPATVKYHVASTNIHGCMLAELHE
jgi:hypothetical protein